MCSSVGLVLVIVYINTSQELFSCYVSCDICDILNLPNFNISLNTRVEITNLFSFTTTEV
jgi:hypothetical protein